MIAEKTQIAIVVDEYGGTDGLVSLEDLIEAIMGNIQDEFDHEEEEVHRITEKFIRLTPPQVLTRLISF